MPSWHHNATVGTPWLTTICLVKSHRYNQTCPYVQLPVRMLTAAVRKCGPWWQKLQHSAGDDEMINTACLLGWIVVTFSEPCQCWQLYSWQCWQLYSWQSHIFLLKPIKCPLLFLKPAQFIHGPYCTWWQLLAAGHCYCAVCVCGQLAECNRWADRKWQLIVEYIQPPDDRQSMYKQGEQPMGCRTNMAPILYTYNLNFTSTVNPSQWSSGA